MRHSVEDDLTPEYGSGLVKRLNDRNPRKKVEMTPDAFEYDVALSFAIKDRAPAEELARLLMERNLKVFLDEYEEGIKRVWGKDVMDHLVNLYDRKSRYCVIFISQHYPLEKWTKVERTVTQERSLRDADEYILPIRLDDTDVPGISEAPGYRDLRQHSMDSIADVLAQKLIETRRQPGSPSKSHDLRSGNIPSTDREAGNKDL